MSNGDKRSVSTDALETLGTIIGEGAGRDAIHLAVEPVVAGETLFPGAHVYLRDGLAWHFTQHAMGEDTTRKSLGIVDPFLGEDVLVGERFWLVVYPRQITSLRHVWTHPAFPNSEVKIVQNVSADEQWIHDFAARLDQTYNALMGAAERWLAAGKWDGYTYDNSETYKDYYDQFPEFWEHYAVVTGSDIPDGKRESFFTCSC